MKFEVVIQAHLRSLTKSELKVANYVLENSQKVLYQTLQELSKETNVGEATVMRFCNKIGCDKFASLKLMIAQEAPKEDEKVASNLIEAIEIDLCNIIRNTSLILDESSVEAAVDIIYKAKRIYFFGVGSSGLSALEAETNFMRIGIHSKAVSDPHFQIMAASTFTSDDAVIACTLSGSTKDIFDSCAVAKQSVAQIIVVTNYVNSPISKLADCVLLTAAKEHIMQGGTLGGTISQLFVIDALKEKYIAKNKAKILKLRSKVAESLVPKTL